MNKYLNRGLIYSWFNSAKVPIMIGIFIWGFVANSNIQSNLSDLKSQISGSFSNALYSEQLTNYLILGVIFIAIYFISQGINKRNTAMFLSSGPYTKKQIKYNELISLLITLTLFVVTYVYIAFMAYIRNREFLSIVEGYQSIILIEIARIVLIGIIAIIFMLIIDSMFSNSVIGFIGMISVIPASILIVVVNIFRVLEYIGVEENFYNLLNVVRGGTVKGYNIIILLDSVPITEIRFKQLFIEIIISLIIIVIMISIFNLVQKRYKLECSNKIFSSKNNENIIVILISTALGSFASLVFVSDFINSIQNKNGQYFPLFGLDLVKGLSADIICIGIVGFIAYKIMKKILKNIV